MDATETELRRLIKRKGWESVLGTLQRIAHRMAMEESDFGTIGIYVGISEEIGDVVEIAKDLIEE